MKITIEIETENPRVAARAMKFAHEIRHHKHTTYSVKVAEPITRRQPRRSTPAEKPSSDAWVDSKIKNILDRSTAPSLRLPTEFLNDIPVVERKDRD